MGDYPLSKQYYDEKVKDRFDKLDPLNNKKRALAIPIHQTKYKNIRDECPKDNITVIPIDQQITNDTINSGDLNYTFKNFKDAFDNYIDDFIPDINKDNQSEDSIENDIIKGKDYSVIAKKWDKSIGYIRNKALKLDVPNRKSKSWKTIILIRYEEV